MNQENKKNLTHMIEMVLSNLSLLLVGVLSSFVLPKLFSQHDYGVYKIFNLYTTYVIILQFGFIDGIYIKYSGKNYGDLDRNKFSGYFIIIIILELIISVFLFLFSIIYLEGDSLFVGITLSIYIIILNATNYFQYISQAVQKFKTISNRNIIKSVFNVLVIVIILLFNKNNSFLLSYQFYIISLIIINLVLLVGYIFTYRKIIFNKPKISLNDLIDFVKIGFPLCLSTFVSTLLLSIDRQVVSIFFSTVEYAKYAFAYNLTTLLSTIMASIALVIFPMMKSNDIIIAKDNYKNRICYVSILSTLMACSYFVLDVIVETFLNNYSDSLIYYKIILPGLIISFPITVIIHNYYKMFNKSLIYFIFSVAILFIAILSDIIMYFAYGTMESISIISVFVMLIWYLLSETYLKVKFGISNYKNILYVIIISVLFYLITYIKLWWIALIVYFIIWCLVTFVFYNKTLVLLLKQNFRLKGKKNLD